MSLADKPLFGALDADVLATRLRQRLGARYVAPRPCGQRLGLAAIMDSNLHNDVIEKTLDHIVAAICANGNDFYDLTIDVSRHAEGGASTCWRAVISIYV